MSTIQREISFSMYNKYQKAASVSHAHLNHTVENDLPVAFVAGYGYYGCGNPYKCNGRYYIPVTIGGSCD